MGNNCRRQRVNRPGAERQGLQLATGDLQCPPTAWIGLPPSTRNTSDSAARGLLRLPSPLSKARLLRLPCPYLSNRRLTVARPNCRRLTNYRHGR